MRKRLLLIQELVAMYRSDPVNEEKGDRRFGGCPFAHPGAYILTNMQATAKQNNITGTDEIR